MFNVNVMPILVFPHDLPSVSWPFLPPPVRHDLMMFQIGDVSLVPQADNPLPRMVLDVDLFNRAVKKGKLGVPGDDNFSMMMTSIKCR